MESIKNDKIEISVKKHGAELASLIHAGRQYLWQADPTFWARHSPVLFPIVGSVWRGEYRSKGAAYRMGQHGFARDMDFTLISKNDHELRYRLTSSDDTKAKYPYDFILEIGYKLIDCRVRVLWRVINSGEEPLPFQIGAHPAFFWPMLSDAAIEGGVEAMAEALSATDFRGYFKLEPKARVLQMSLITEGGCFGTVEDLPLEEGGYLPLTVDTFDRNALVFEDSQVSKVTLCDQNKKPYISVEFSSPLVGLWSPPQKRAPFVCIEPWYGRADSVNFTGDFFEKKWIQILEPGNSFDAFYDIIVE